MSLYHNEHMKNNNKQQQQNCDSVNKQNMAAAYMRTIMITSSHAKTRTISNW